MLSRFCFRHPYNMVKLYMVVQVCSFVWRDRIVFHSPNQFFNPLLSRIRRFVSNDLLWSHTLDDNVDKFGVSIYDTLVWENGTEQSTCVGLSQFITSVAIYSSTGTCTVSRDRSCCSFS